MTHSQLFHDAVDAHGATVLRACASVLGPGPQAEDAWSETFLAALVAWPLDEVRNLEAWLVTVARRKCIDIMRASQRVTPVDDDLLVDALGPSWVGDPASGWDDELWGHVAQLTPRQQYVVAHRFIAQWTYPEIADALGCSPAAARRCGADAIAALRTRLASLPGGSSHV